MKYVGIEGVPQFSAFEYVEKKNVYCLLIPIINEGDKILIELKRAVRYGIPQTADIVICDGGSTDGCTREATLKKLQVNTLLVKEGYGKQGAQLRMGIWWAMQRGYKGIVTIDGNNKDSIENVIDFVERLEAGYDFIQGSRFIKGGHAVRTPLIRLLSVRLLHAPIISLTAGYWFTDTTNNFRGYSMKYLTEPGVQPLRDIFMTYELLAYLSVRASQVGLKVCEIPVTRRYPKGGKVPTKISPFKGNSQLMKILILNLLGKYKPAAI